VTGEGSDRKRVAVTLGGASAVSDECYLAALRMAGLDPVPLYPAADEPDVRVALASAHGLVLSGGADVHPSRYGEEPSGAEMKFVSEARDAMEWAALDDADRRGLPILAICRGAQMLNVFRGGGLLQDIGQAHRDGRQQAEKWRAFHSVELDGVTRLAEAVGSTEAEVNSRHHQAIDRERIGEGLRVTGWCPADGIVEALEGDDALRFVVGVQWHPENMTLGPEDTIERAQARGIFEAFASAVSEFAAARGGGASGSV